MATEVTEIKTYFGRCRCCLEYGYLKSMWDAHRWEGDTEVYGEMITECFAFTLEKQSNVDQDEICETCITKLRDACSFKTMVIKSQRQLMQEVPIDIDNLKQENSIKGDSDNNADDPQNLLETDLEIEICNIDGGAVVIPAEDPPYEDVEYLEEDIVIEKANHESHDSTPDESNESGPSKKQWPKKLPRNQRNRTYMQYTEEDLRNSVEAVKTDKMSQLEAAEYYNVPRKTLAARLKMDMESTESDPDREKFFEFLKEIKTILTFTNGTPFKTRAGRYCCAYCIDVSTIDPAELRNHTRTAHIDDRTKKVDLMMRPHWLNEILKLDIENLLCVVCCTPIYKWNDMFKHLKDKHQVELEQAHRKVIPYNLGAELECALCKESFMHHIQLDGHMNSHYDNYVCGACGDTFLTAPRLRSHMKIHVMGKYPCNHCEKVFRLDHYRKKHEAVVHKQSLYYKCMDCGVKFGSERERKNHVAEVHSEKLKTITCDQCGKTFKWRHYFLSHVRKAHSDKQHQCVHCGKQYHRKAELEGHIAAKHNGVKRYHCQPCNKKYSSLAGLRLHQKAHKSRGEKIT